MKNKLNIKVCGLVQTENIHEIATYQPDYMGFIFYPESPRYVINLNEDVMRELASMSKTTGVFVDADISVLVDMAKKYALRVVQLHGNESPAYCREIHRLLPKVEIVKAFGINDSYNFQQLPAYEDCVDYFLFDTQSEAKGGTGKQFDWSLLKNYQGKKKFFLSGGIAPEDVSTIESIEDERMYAIDINSRFERRPGVKDSKKVGEFIHSIRFVK